MVRGVAEEARARFRKEAPVPTIALGENDLVEKLDARIFSARRLSLVNELIECLRLSQHVHIFAVAMWYALQELVHVEVVDESLLLSLARGRVHVASISVEQ